jgi:hypothetical protein
MTKCEEIMQFQVRPNDLVVVQVGEVKATNTHEVRLPSAKAEHATFSHLVFARGRPAARPEGTLAPGCSLPYCNEATFRI